MESHTHTNTVDVEGPPGLAELRIIMSSVALDRFTVVGRVTVVVGVAARSHGTRDYQLL